MSMPFRALRTDEDPLDPFVPTPTDSFDRRKAAHLLRRAGFGAPAAEVTRAVEEGLDRTLDRLLAKSSGDDPFDALQGAVQGTLLDFYRPEQLKTWWLFRMQTSRRQLEEKLVLFWHNHFATSNSKVDRADLMFEQNKTFRAHAFGPFNDMLLAVSRDPAMVMWLDGNTNKKGKPNENYARELLELFSMGQGPYSEKDVMEGARAFSGWNLSGSTFEFKADQHDDGEKTFLGRTGKLNGTDIIDVILTRPETAVFLVRKLCATFCQEHPDAAVIDRLAATLRESGYDFAVMLRRLFASKLFFSAVAWRAVVKSPAELVVGAARELGAQFSLTDCATFLRQMGQDLFYPPTVKGWNGGMEWLNSATVIERMNFAKALAHARSPASGSRTAPEEICAREKLDEPEAIVGYFLALHLQGDVPAAFRQALSDYMVHDDGGKPRKWAKSGRGFEAKVRGLIHLVLASPEYQLA